jgi:low temperature requirement protein LtrA
MAPRDPAQAHRTATPLELLVDLTFVVAVAQCGASLHHALATGHGGDALFAYPATFFAIWWAWMNFTWFASAFDVDDPLYRLATLVQMAGVLVLAAGVPRAFADGDFAVVTLGYVIMRVALIGQWLRASCHPDSRDCARRYALGIGLCQFGWVGLLLLPEGLRGIGFVVMAIAELAVPVWAERVGRTSWHPGHIAERYGLFTIIVLGESILAATVAVQSALDTGHALGDLVTIAIGGLLIVFSLWWVAFDLPTEAAAAQAREVFETTARHAFIWGYGHLVVFASATAVGVGLTLAVDRAVGDGSISQTGAGLAVTVPVAVYLLTAWVLHRTTMAGKRFVGDVVGVTALAVLALSWLSEVVLATGLVLAAAVTVLQLFGPRTDRSVVEPD